MTISIQTFCHVPEPSQGKVPIEVATDSRDRRNVKITCQHLPKGKADLDTDPRDTFVRQKDLIEKGEGHFKCAATGEMCQHLRATYRPLNFREREV